MVKQSTILIRSPTRERLKQVAYKGQTYDDIINYLIDLKIRIQEQAHNRAENLQSGPTTTGQSLGQKSTQGSSSLNG